MQRTTVPSFPPVPSFDELIQNCHHSAVHLEMRDITVIDAEAAEYQAWLREQPAKRVKDAEYHTSWRQTVAEATERGVSMRRARIVSQPVSDYVRFLHAGTWWNIEAGEQVRWLPRHKATSLLLPAADLWLFDDQVIRWHHFSGKGDYADEELCEDPQITAAVSKAFEQVWEIATDHAEFVL